jgi:serine/threonine-protein kinase HipA
MNKKNQYPSIEVHAHWAGLPQPCLVGNLHSTLSRGKEIFSFAYDPTWLKCDISHNLDPSLQLLSGIQYAPLEQGNFGIFLDSAPDRWGRFLMDRREAQIAREEGRKETLLTESDYLLGVYDAHRIGALRFRLNAQPPFLDSNKALASPPWTSLRELEQASLCLEKDDAYKNPSYSAWLNMLIIPGSSLGGARPKASVIDPYQHLWIAKFPSAHDDHDIGGWEMVVHQLAKRAKINVAEAELRKFNTRHHTFLSKRFDRTNSHERIHFVSAMTLLQRKDGDDASTGVSYLELAEFIIQQGSQVLQDLEQLWRRIVFFICVSNVDDHLRNHGFILEKNGWRLSPAYDMNPVASGHGLKLNISESDNSQDLDLALEVAEYFRITPIDAAKIIRDTIEVVKDWRKEAAAFKISITEQDRMARAFRMAEN